MKIITALNLAIASLFLAVSSAHDVDIKQTTITIIENRITTTAEFPVSEIATPLKMLNIARSDSVLGTVPLVPAVPPIDVSSADSDTFLGTVPFVPAVQPITVTVTSDYESKTSDLPSTSSRPAASGFWTGDDPFSFIPPSTFTQKQSTSTSSNISTEETSSSTTSSSEDDMTTTSTDDSDITVTEDSSVPAFVTSGEATSIPAVVTSISTHTNWVTATPFATYNASQSVTTTTSQDLGKHMRSVPGIGIAMALLLQLL